MITISTIRTRWGSCISDEGWHIYGFYLVLVPAAGVEGGRAMSWQHGAERNRIARHRRGSDQWSSSIQPESMTLIYSLAWDIIFGNITLGVRGPEGCLLCDTLDTRTRHSCTGHIVIAISI